MKKSVRKTWDCHNHKDELQVSDACTVFHPTKGQLCIGDSDSALDRVLYYPIQFKTKQAAWKWINEGTIADIQESLCNLHVGFSRHCMK